jgi:hypothetical protein
MATIQTPINKNDEAGTAQAAAANEKTAIKTPAARGDQKASES